jgi:hypothetical protein
LFFVLCLQEDSPIRGGLFCCTSENVGTLHLLPFLGPSSVLHHPLHHVEHPLRGVLAFVARLKMLVFLSASLLGSHVGQYQPCSSILFYKYSKVGRFCQIKSGGGRWKVRCRTCRIGGWRGTGLATWEDYATFSGR